VNFDAMHLKVFAVTSVVNVQLKYFMDTISNHIG
jgi:hypothetical protein